MGLEGKGEKKEVCLEGGTQRTKTFCGKDTAFVKVEGKGRTGDIPNPKERKKEKSVITPGKDETVVSRGEGVKAGRASRLREGGTCRPFPVFGKERRKEKKGMLS